MLGLAQASSEHPCGAGNGEQLSSLDAWVGLGGGQEEFRRTKPELGDSRDVGLVPGRVSSRKPPCWELGSWAIQGDE